MAAVTATQIGNIVGKRLLNANKNQIRRIKTVMVTSDATADGAGTMTLTLANYGLSATGLLAVRGVVHTTLNSVIEIQAQTTSVTAGVLTITDASANTDKVRYFLLIGEEA